MLMLNNAPTSFLFYVYSSVHGRLLDRNAVGGIVIMARGYKSGWVGRQHGESGRRAGTDSSPSRCYHIKKTKAINLSVVINNG